MVMRSRVQIHYFNWNISLTVSQDKVKLVKKWKSKGSHELHIDPRKDSAFPGAARFEEEAKKTESAAGSLC